MATILGIREEVYKSIATNPAANPAKTTIAAEAVTEWNQTHHSFADRAVAEVAFVGITVLGILETLASAIYTLIVKGASIFVSDKAKFEESVVTAAKVYTASAFLCTNIAMVSLIENLKNEKIGNTAFDKVINFYRKA